MRQAAASLLLFSLCCVHPSARSDQGAYLESLRCVGGNYGLSLPNDVRRLSSLGKPSREEVSEVEKWDGYTATRKALHFDGLILGVVEFSNDPARLVVTHAEVSAARWNRLVPFKIGEPVAKARAVFGSSIQGDLTLERSYGSESDSVIIESRSGIVTRVVYQCYSG